MLKKLPQALKVSTEWTELEIISEADVILTSFGLPPKCIMGVILRCYSTKELPSEILELRRDDPELGHLQIQQAHVSQRHYRLDIGEIET